MMDLFIKSLAGEFALIKSAYEKNNTTELARLIHRLHGALCYVDLPLLKKSTIAIEKSLKNKEPFLETLFADFEIEVHRLLKTE